MHSDLKIVPDKDLQWRYVKHLSNLPIMTCHNIYRRLENEALVGETNDSNYKSGKSPIKLEFSDAN